MVEVFKTNVIKIRNADLLVKKLLQYLPESRINFDLDDCDNILRVEDNYICSEKIIRLLAEAGYNCEILV